MASANIHPSLYFWNLLCELHYTNYRAHKLFLDFKVFDHDVGAFVLLHHQSTRITTIKQDQNWPNSVTEALIRFAAPLLPRRQLTCWCVCVTITNWLVRFFHAHMNHSSKSKFQSSLCAQEVIIMKVELVSHGLHRRSNYHILGHRLRNTLTTRVTRAI